VDRQDAAAKTISAYWDGWHAAFPALHKRGHWHIVHHLCTEAQAGAPLGELLGLTRQALLVDDATVRDRVEELLADGQSVTEPPGATLSSRVILVPTPALLAQYDSTLLSLLATMADIVPMLQPEQLRPHLPTLTPAARALALDGVAAVIGGWSSLVDMVCEARGLSQARRLEARRHLLSTSHRTILLVAIVHGEAPPRAGIQADRIAAALLERTGQNFQTTRDHIAALVTLGVLERRAGRALTVGVASSVLPQIRAALGGVADELASIMRRAVAPAPGVYALRVQAPGEAPRVVDITRFPFTIGRTEGNALRLAAQDVSRAHCHLSLQGEQIIIADLGSTNGTMVDGKQITGAVALADGAVISLGPFLLTFLAPDDTSDSTIRHRA
jgi:hypothetical protein